jgi:glycosyltransferase involved in cell wall biosynthesis
MTKIIPVGVEESLLELVPVAKEKFTLIHIGSSNWLPNLDGIRWFLNEIFPLVIETIHEVKLYLYGGGDYSNLGLADKIKSHVVLKGFVEDIWSEISDKELAIVPLRIGSGIRVKILELLAAGKNILTTSLGAEGISVENNKHLLIADPPELFAQKIIDYFRGEFDSDQLTLNGKQLIKDHFVWDKIAEEFEESFKKLIDKK